MAQYGGLETGKMVCKLVAQYGGLGAGKMVCLGNLWPSKGV